MLLIETVRYTDVHVSICICTHAGPRTRSTVRGCVTIATVSPPTIQYSTARVSNPAAQWSLFTRLEVYVETRACGVSLRKAPTYTAIALSDRGNVLLMPILRVNVPTIPSSSVV